ncbi:MAG: DUF4293 domain-containing protein [Microscillaceae bacterium]|nr:DUF4293 domain-containing protein [Microscillaceae bacterium]
MIQRIQSVFLFFVGFFMVLMLFFPIWKKENPETKEATVLTATTMIYSKDGVEVKKQATFYIAGLALVSAILAFYTIFLYTNRITQIKLVMFNTILICLVLGLMVYIISLGEKTFGPSLKDSYLVGYYLPIPAALLSILARRFIKKDEDLVRSSNRMR